MTSSAPARARSAAPGVEASTSHVEAPARVPTRVNDELAWELVRDEWELLLAVGSGPTTAAQAAHALSSSAAQVDKRLQRLLDKNLVRKVATGEGFELVPAFYERREGMSSYLRDLVLRRLTDTQSAAPLSARAQQALGDKAAMAALIARAERDLFPEVVALANRPESDRSERFSVFFAFSDMEHAPKKAAGQPDDFRAQLLSVLQAAATARSLQPDTRSSYLWVAEMRTDPEVAQEIGDLLERFVDTIALSPAAAVSRIDAREGPTAHGALAFAVLPNQTSRLATAPGLRAKVGI